jgi:argininosuccinate lyase
MTANKHTSPTAPGLNPVALDFSASIGYDWILYPFDIAASIAHARMLGKQGIIPSEDADLIVRGLGDIEDEIEAGDFEWREDLEDIHLNIEIRLREKIGDAGARLHTARSRNDQIATDVRLFVMNACGLAVERIRGLQSALLALAETHTDTLFPGYTHLQRAQPVLFAHHLLAYFEMLDRDAERFAECYGRADEMPLGSGALAGVPYDVDRDFVARELGFTRVSRNSIDAVSDRDFAVDFHAAAAMTMTHLSRLGEEIILWSSEEFRFIRLPDDFATGSSIMPQKRNPDMAELTRGKAGRVVGNLVAALTMLKGLPLSYNRDLQEDKEPLFDTTKTVLAALEVMAEMVPGIAVDSGRVASAASSGYLLATDAADYLVRKGVAFRDAHQAVSALVRYAEEHEKQLNELSIDDYRRFSPDFDDDIILAIDAMASVTSRDVPGGTAPARVQQALAEARARLAESEE